MKKLLEISPFYKCVPKTTITWGTVPEIQSETEFFVILGHFLPFYPLPLTTQKIKKSQFSKNEKSFWRYYHFTLAHQKKNMIIWCMLTQIWSVTDIIFCDFRPFLAVLPHYWPQKLKFGKNVKNSWKYYPFTHVYHKWKSYDIKW